MAETKDTYFVLPRAEVGTHTPLNTNPHKNKKKQKEKKTCHIMYWELRMNWSPEPENNVMCTVRILCNIVIASAPKNVNFISNIGHL